MNKEEFETLDEEQKQAFDMSMSCLVDRLRLRILLKEIEEWEAEAIYKYVYDTSHVE